MSGSAIGLGLQVGGQISSGLAQASQLRQSAAVDDANAQRTLFQGALDSQALRDRERATSGEAIAAQGGSGLAVGTGSAYDLLYQNALERERAVLNTRYSAATAADSLAVSASAKRSAASASIFSSLIGAGTTAIFGAQKIADGDALSKANAAWRARSVPGGYTMPVPSTPTYGGGARSPTGLGSGKAVWNYGAGGLSSTMSFGS